MRNDGNTLAAGSRLFGRLVAILMVWAWTAPPLWGAAQANHTAPPTVPSTTPEGSHSQVLRQYCVSCHNERVKAGGLLLDKMDVANVPADAEAWEKVVRKLRVGSMPPPGMPRPDRRTLDGLVGWLETALDRAAAARPNPGRPSLHRLNRAEYANAIRDLLALDVDVASLLPPDDSELRVRQHRRRARRVAVAAWSGTCRRRGTISALAVGDPTIAPGSDDVPRSARISRRTSTSRGCRSARVGGHARAPHVSARRRVHPAGQAVSHEPRTPCAASSIPHQLEITRGRRAGASRDAWAATPTSTALFDNADRSGRCHRRAAAGARAGESRSARRRRRLRPEDRGSPSTVGCKPFLRSSADTLDYDRTPSCRRGHDRRARSTRRARATRRAAGRSSCAVRRGALPTKAPCATQILSTLARRAYPAAGHRRRPSAAASISIDAGRRDGNVRARHPDGAAAHPGEPGVPVPRRARSGRAWRPARSIASATSSSRRGLSFFLWSSIPDDELLTLASQGRLEDPAVLEQQVRRMLADPRSRRAGRPTSPASGCTCATCGAIVPELERVPGLRRQPAPGVPARDRAVLRSIMREDRSVLDLLTADYTFVNERLAGTTASRTSTAASSAA